MINGKRLDYKYKIYTLIVLIFTITVFGCGGSGGGSGGNDSGVNDSGGRKSDSGGSGSTIVDSVTLSWDEPDTNDDGSPLTDLAGYKVYYGTSSYTYTQSVDVGKYTGAVINNLSPGTWCFSITAYDTSGNESGNSNELCTTVG